MANSLTLLASLKKTQISLDIRPDLSKYSNEAFVLFCLFDLFLYVPSKIFQLNRDGSSWVEPVLSLYKCALLKDHNSVTPVRLEPTAPRSRVKHSTTESHVNDLRIAAAVWGHDLFFTVSVVKKKSIKYLEICQLPLPDNRTTKIGCTPLVRMQNCTMDTRGSRGGMGVQTPSPEK